MTTGNDTDTYISLQPAAMQPLLQQMRTIIRAAAPQAEETISYGMPALRYCGRILVYYAAAKKHIGFYPTPSGITAFAAEKQEYVHAKGSVQFPTGQPLPDDLITRIVQFRVQENEAAETKK